MATTMSKKKRKALEAKPFVPATLDVARRIQRQLLHGDLGYPRACPNRRCRRHRRCVGDPDFCHAIFWPVVPEETKVWLRSLASSGRARRGVKKAEELANDAVRDYRLRARAFKRLEEHAVFASHK